VPQYGQVGQVALGSRTGRYIYRPVATFFRLPVPVRSNTDVPDHNERYKSIHKQTIKAGDMCTFVTGKFIKKKIVKEEKTG